MVKRYRRPKTIPGQIKFQKGKVDGDVDMCIFYGDDVPRCDRALIMNFFASKRMGFDIENRKPVFNLSLLDELDSRGYDLDTLKFSIDKKSQTQSIGIKGGEK